MSQEAGEDESRRGSSINVDLQMNADERWLRVQAEGWSTMAGAHLSWEMKEGGRQSEVPRWICLGKSMPCISAIKQKVSSALSDAWTRGAGRQERFKQGLGRIMARKGSRTDRPA